MLELKYTGTFLLNCWILGTNQFPADNFSPFFGQNVTSRISFVCVSNFYRAVKYWFKLYNIIFFLLPCIAYRDFGKKRFLFLTRQLFNLSFWTLVCPVLTLLIKSTFCIYCLLLSWTCMKYLLLEVKQSSNGKMIIAPC